MSWNHPQNHDKLDYMVFPHKKVLKIVILRAPQLNVGESEVKNLIFFGLSLVRAQTW